MQNSFEYDRLMAKAKRGEPLSNSEFDYLYPDPRAPKKPTPSGPRVISGEEIASGKHGLSLSQLRAALRSGAAVVEEANPNEGTIRAGADKFRIVE